tara:strand:- start:2759 stop:2965 length:207 start_codon:yes stop_codon:yes gene_type:complete
MRKIDNGKGHRIREKALNRRRKRQSKKRGRSVLGTERFAKKKAVDLATAGALLTASMAVPAKETVDGA